MNAEYPYETDEMSLNKKPELPLIWILPICAFIVSGWLIYRSASQKGPEITIDFPTAEGLEVDKTKIRYLDVEIGKVTDININPDSKTIRVTAQMHRTAENYLNKNTSFWVVRPQVGLAGISGLNTLISGAYIEVKPGDGPHQHHFTGLPTAPVLRTEANGRQFVLETSNLGSLGPRTPINFHGIPVGEVLSHDLSSNADSIRLVIFIKSPYDQFVRKNTRFWKDSGIDLSAGADGFKVRTGPLVSVLSGGIAFRTAPNDTLQDVQPEFALFHLYDNYDQSTQIEYRNTLKYVMYFNGSVRGLAEGAPVELRGIPIGRVTGISLELDAGTADIRIPVTAELEPDRIQEINKLPDISNQDMMSRLITKGLRAQLRTGSLLTGQLLVDLDFHPGTKTALHAGKGPYPEFPTIPSSLDQFTHSAQTIMDKIAKLPLNDVATELHATLKSLQATSKAADDVLVNAKGAMKSADSTLQSADRFIRSLEPGSATRQDLDALIIELNESASSIRQLTDYIEQHPEALLRGKGDQQ